MYEWRQTNQTFSPRQSDRETQAVGEERAIGVTPVWEVDHTQQLGEQDHIHQVRTQGPDTIVIIVDISSDYVQFVANKMSFLYEYRVTKVRVSHFVCN